MPQLSVSEVTCILYEDVKLYTVGWGSSLGVTSHFHSNPFTLHKPIFSWYLNYDSAFHFTQFCILLSDASQDTGKDIGAWQYNSLISTIDWDHNVQPGHLFLYLIPGLYSFLPRREQVKEKKKPLKVNSNDLPQEKELCPRCSQQQCQLSLLIYSLEIEK